MGILKQKNEDWR